VAYHPSRARARRSFRSGALIITAALIATACKATKTPDAAPAAPAAAVAPVAPILPLGPVPDDSAAMMLKSFKLTMPALQQFAKAQLAFDKVTKADPAILATLRQRSQNGTLDNVVAGLTEQPKLRSALAAAGSSPRTFIVTGMALTQSMEGLQMMAQNKPLPAGLSPATLENISFVQKNLAAIRALLAPGQK
jgi:hypothetical protein